MTTEERESRLAIQRSLCWREGVNPGVFPDVESDETPDEKRQEETPTPHTEGRSASDALMLAFGTDVATTEFDEGGEG